MSRNYANFATAIWRPEDDFGNLTMPAQWAYFMLGTQPDISAAGVLSLNVRRWSKRARGVTRDVVVEALKELQAAEKVFYDYDTEELLIRTFVKADGGYGNQKRRPVIERAALELESPRLRAVLAAELRKLGDELMTKLADRLSAPYGIAYAAERPPNVPPTSSASTKPAVGEPDKTASSQVDSPSDALSHSDGVVVTQGLVVDPQPSTRTPQTQPSVDAPSRPKRETGPRGTRLPADWTPSEKLLKWFADKGFTFDMATQHEKFMNHWLAKSGKDSAKLDWDATWRNWMITAADHQPRSGQRFGHNGIATGANKHHDSQDRRPRITGLRSSDVLAEQAARGDQ
jgi:hypothetical protein